MWRTSHGERTLHGAEARLFAETLLDLLDEAEQLDDCDVGLPCFDNLTFGQQVWVLSIIGNGLLRDDVPVVPLTAVLESGIAAVFEQLRVCVSFEIDARDLGTRWREMVVAARVETGGEDITKVTCRKHREWDCEIEELSDCILWDADYEDGDLYLDRPPKEARALRKEMGISQGYFTAVAEDLTDEQADDRIAELRRVCERVVGQRYSRAIWRPSGGHKATTTRVARDD